MLYLDRNENQYGPSPACYEALRQANLEQLSLYSRTYTRGKKSDLSDRLSQRTGIPEERILLSYGSEDMLKQVVHCYLKSGDTILLPRQSWWYYKSVAGEVLGNQVEYPIHERGDRFAYDAADIVRLYEQHHPQLILIASPSNPTGNSIARENLERIIGHCTNAIIVLDEAYYGFTIVSPSHLRELLEQHQRLAILRTFSKYYALAGLRIGYACIGTDLKRLVSYSARYLGYNQLTERIALAALDSDEYYSRTARQIREDNEEYFALFSELPGFVPYRTEANFILVRHQGYDKKALQTALANRRVIVKFLDDPGLENCIRITTGTREQNLVVVQVFREAASSLAV